MADTPQKERKLGLSRTRVGGRFVTAYTPDLAFKIVERVAEGETLAQICEDDEMPTRQTFHRWVVNTPELSRAYAAARELSAHAMEEEALDLARRIVDAPDTTTKIRAFDVAMGQLRWSASRRNPKTYSERGAVTITVPIQINTSLDLGGGDVSAEHPDIYSIDAVVAETTDRDPSIEVMQRDTLPLVVKSTGGMTKEQRAKAVRARMDKLAEEAKAEGRP